MAAPSSRRSPTKPATFAILILVAGAWVLTPVVLAKDKELVFRSSGPTGPRRGRFASPLWPNKYPPGLRSRYVFIARHDERVMIKFHNFNIEGLSPDCVKDFMDIYIQMRTADEPLSATVQHGRFCGHTMAKVPQVLVSMYNIIVLDFYADPLTAQNYNHDDHMGDLGFNGTYEFIPSAPYAMGQRLDGGSDCSFLIDSKLYSSGRIMSPTYPGVYPNYLNCTYIFRGLEGQRVRLAFDDFDLYVRSNSCPIDYVEIIDSDRTDRRKRIGLPFCGQQQHLIIFSTTNTLRMEFITNKGRSNTEGMVITPYRDNIQREKIQSRGFSATFRFSVGFVKIEEDGLKANHYRGTECDYFIRSNGTTDGVITSPNYPSRLEEGKLCTYFLYGIFNKQDRERVQLHIKKFRLPPPNHKGECLHGSLSVFKSTDSFVAHTPSMVLCGTLRDEQKLFDTERESQLILVLNTTGMPQGQDYLFKAQYKFLVEYGIAGDAVSPGACHFTYSNKNGGRVGFLNSPFYPDHYPANRTCRYDLVVTGSEFVRLSFLNFHTADEPAEGVAKKEHHTAGMRCTRDFLEILERVANPLTGGLEVRPIVRYCALFIPGPWVIGPRSTELILRFHSNQNRTTTGFRAEYEFLPKTRLFDGPCGGNLTSDKHGGVIMSPNYPKPYPSGLLCEWHIHPSEPGHTLMLHFADFEIEGSPRSCAFAILRIYEEDNVLPHSELCGTDSNIPSFLSRARFLRVRFLTTRHSSGGKGFKISWTELLPRAQGRCGGFECLVTRYCIDPSLECNGVPNCGTYLNPDNTSRSRDLSDESLNSPHCRNASNSSGPVTASYNLLHVGIGILLTVIILVVIVVSILYREHRRTQLKQKDPLGEGAATKRLVVPGSPTSPPPPPSLCNDLTLAPGATPPEVFSLTYRNGCGGTVGGGGGGGGGGVGGGGSIIGGSGTLTREKMQKISIV